MRQTPQAVKKYKKGDTVVFRFHYAGLVSEEEATIVKVRKDGTIEIEQTNADDQHFRFNTTTGKCLNDSTSLGAKRTLKID